MLNNKGSYSCNYNVLSIYARLLNDVLCPTNYGMNYPYRSVIYWNVFPKCLIYLFL